LRAPGPERSEQRGPARERRLARRQPLRPRREDNKRPEIVGAIVEPSERDGPFPAAPSAFDHGVLTVGVTHGLERPGQPGVREVACARHSLWQGQWRRMEAGAAAVRHTAPQRLRRFPGLGRSGETKTVWAFPKTIR